MPGFTFPFLVFSLSHAVKAEQANRGDRYRWKTARRQDQAAHGFYAAVKPRFGLDFACFANGDPKGNQIKFTEVTNNDTY